MNEIVTMLLCGPEMLSETFINDVYRFGWTGLEFTPIWRG
jgi:hypothetical protein